ncbi:DNA-binding transcriptional regulator [Beijerinckia sp. L45]|uniref:helix-turn-helix domain-containing protein n=1 Tax=Beijerinckia sp. L45 TaxID=1641855 RepID=UPI001FF000C5|nr:helix-turn-helix domain-containing protein [Beijerinckia sp. L45]
MIETAKDMHASGVMDDEAFAKITLRQSATTAEPLVAPLSGEDIRSLRETANMSQAVFARYLNLTVGYVSQLERGTKRPSGPALVLLNIIRRSGIGALQ